MIRKKILYSGKGWSYGTELFINKSKGRFTGWIGYTLSAGHGENFLQLNIGEKYPAKYDRRHDLTVVAIYELNKKWKFSAVFVYGTGNATTLPERFYIVNGVLTQEYSRINEYGYLLIIVLIFLLHLPQNKNETES